MSMIDPDKKVEEIKEKRESLYQSSQHPEHFYNEGSEYENIGIEDNNDISENADYDKILGVNERAKNKQMDKLAGMDKEKKEES